MRGGEEHAALRPLIVQLAGDDDTGSASDWRPSISAPRPFRRTNRAALPGASLRHAIWIRECEQRARQSG